MIKINVGGKTFTSSKETLTSRCTPNYFSSYIDWNGSPNYIFIDRDPKFFNIILNHIRGYTVELPDDPSELQMIYEDAQFYGIRSLMFELERILGLRLSKKERFVFQEYIKAKVMLHNIQTHVSSLEFLDRMTDPELTNLKKKIETISHDIEQDKIDNTVFMGLMLLFTYLEKHYDMLKGMSVALQSRYADAFQVIRGLRRDHNSFIKVAMFFLSVMNSTQSGDG